MFLNLNLPIGRSTDNGEKKTLLGGMSQVYISQYFEIKTKYNDLEEKESGKVKWRNRAREREEKEKLVTGGRLDPRDELCVISVLSGVQAGESSVGCREFSV